MKYTVSISAIKNEHRINFRAFVNHFWLKGYVFNQTKQYYAHIWEQLILRKIKVNKKVDMSAASVKFLMSGFILFLVDETFLVPRGLFIVVNVYQTFY